MTAPEGRDRTWLDLRLWINQAGTVLHVEGCPAQPPFPMRRAHVSDDERVRHGLLPTGGVTSEPNPATADPR